MGYITAEVDGNRVRVWERQGGVRVTKYFDAPAEFYYEDANGAHRSMSGERLRKVTFKNLRDLRAARDQYREAGVRLYESDISPAIKVLSREYNGVVGEPINICFLDIEVDYDPEVGYSTVADPYAPISSIALYNHWVKQSIVLAVPPPNWDPHTFDESLRTLADIRLFTTEGELLLALLDLIEDADILVGWNSNLFDFPYIGKRILRVLGEKHFQRLSFDDGRPPRWREVEVFGEVHEALVTSGRLLGDYMMLYKKFEFGERESYKLESIAEQHLPDLPKLTYEGSLADLYRNDFNHFIRYNIRDTEILCGFEEALGYVGTAVFLYRDATGLFDNVTGTVRLADYSVYNYCHHELGVRVKDITNNTNVTVSLKGAHVLNPQVGMHKWAASVDVSSLYPSAIRSVNISPETLVGQFQGFWDDVELIATSSPTPITFRDEATGEFITESAALWRRFLDNNNMTVSGYGTVFTLQKQGILPTILERWYQMRVETNDEIKKLEDDIAAICKRYTPMQKGASS